MRTPEEEAPGSTELVHASSSGPQPLEMDMSKMMENVSEPNKSFEVVTRDEAKARREKAAEEHAERTRLRHRTLTDEEMWEIVKREEREREQLEREQQDRMEQ